MKSLPEFSTTKPLEAENWVSLSSRRPKHRCPLSTFWAPPQWWQRCQDCDSHWVQQIQWSVLCFREKKYQTWQCCFLTIRIIWNLATNFKSKIFILGWVKIYHLTVTYEKRDITRIIQRFWSPLLITDRRGALQFSAARRSREGHRVTRMPGPPKSTPLQLWWKCIKS